MAESEAERILELQAEVAQLKEAVASHAVVDQAIGMMVALGRVTPDAGWEVLKEVSQHTNIKLRNIAELIVIWGRRGDIPPEIGAQLEDALDRYGPTQVPGTAEAIPVVDDIADDATHEERPGTSRDRPGSRD